MEKIPLIVVPGATASGKTALGIQLAQLFGGEVVSADSMQIYKQMNIGTAKPTAKEMQGIAHHLLDFVEPDQAFSVAEYTELAHATVAAIHRRGKVPVMVGGTGLYINSVVNDVSFGETDANQDRRHELELLAQEQGGQALLRLLEPIDPASAKVLHPNNQRRIIRAIEFYEQTGVPISEHQKQTQQVQSRYEPVMVAISWEREVLYQRIGQRVDLMLEAGLLEEVRQLMDKGYTKHMNSMKGIGYKEVMDYFRGLMTYEEMVHILKRDSRRYAKRQLTWFRRDQRIHWIPAGSQIAEKAAEYIKEQWNKK